MTGPFILQLFLYVNIFAMGALVVVAFQHARAHVKPHKHSAAEHPERDARLPQAVKRRLLRTAETHYKTVLDRSAAELQHSLQTTSTNLVKQLHALNNDIIRDETAQFKATLEALRKDAEANHAATQNTTEQHHTELQQRLQARQKELEAKLDTQYASLEVAMNERLASEEKQRLDQLDAKLADAVLAFLSETLQHEVDLGAQAPYLTAMLEEHKDELTKKIA